MTVTASRYQILRPLTEIEYQNLKGDIATRGVLVAVERDEDGNTLDGHHRERACAELGITDYPVVIRSGLTEAEKLRHLYALNEFRRHDGPVSWARHLKALAEAEGGTLGSGGGPAGNRPTVGRLAGELGVKRTTAFRRLALADELEPHPDLAERVDAGELGAKQALRIVRERQARSRPAPAASAVPATVDLRQGDFREALADVPDGSVQLIATDPPYLRSTMPIYRDLGVFAARVLAPSGLLLAEVGTMFVPEAIGLLGEHLAYWWCIAQVLPGKRARVYARKAINGWRPVLVFSRKDGQPGHWLHDVITVSEPPDKRWHVWQKAVAPTRSYIERLTSPGDLVADPFLGSGTAAIAALEAGRSFVGCDLDPEALRVARIRVADAAKGGQ